MNSSSQRDAYDDNVSISSFIAIKKIFKVVVIDENLRDYMKIMTISASLSDLKQILNATQLSYR